MKQLLTDLDACRDARELAADKTWKEIFETCHRGDWLLWLFRKTNPADKRLITLAKGHCANTVRHLMKDERSIKAVDAAIAYGNNEITDNDLSATAADAYAATDTAAATYSATYSAAAAYAATDTAAATYSATYSAAAAAADADAATATAADAAAYAATAAAADAARIKSQLETANICRKYLPIEVWNITEDGKIITP